VQVGFAVFRRQDMGGAPKTLVTLSFAYCLPGAPAVLVLPSCHYTQSQTGYLHDCGAFQWLRNAQVLSPRDERCKLSCAGRSSLRHPEPLPLRSEPEGPCVLALTPRHMPTPAAVDLKDFVGKVGVCQQRQRQQHVLTPCHVHRRAVNLKDFVGKVGVYGDVNDSLTASMAAFAQFVEENDLEEIKRVRAEGRTHAAEKMEEMWATYDVSWRSIL
jgi:hypothetical protein